jgi:hypothetical protein
MIGLAQLAPRPGMQQQPGRPPVPVAPASARFILPVGQCEFQLTNALEQLQRDPWPVANDKRPLRCTGVALSVAAGLLEASNFTGTGARIMLFAGGPATEGPGMVVGPELREPIRSHHDIDRDNIKYYKKALKFYEALAKRITNNAHIVDIFAGCLDQVGLLEMRGLANTSGGHMILTDSFTSSMYKQSFARVFNKDADDNLLMGFDGSLEVLTTKELKVTGLIGHAVSANKKSLLERLSVVSVTLVFGECAALIPRPATVFTSKSLDKVVQTRWLVGHKRPSCNSSQSTSTLLVNTTCAVSFRMGQLLLLLIGFSDYRRPQLEWSIWRPCACSIV